VLYLGIDGGGSKTEAVLCDECGRIKAYARTGATAPSSISESQLMETLRDLFAKLQLEQRGYVRGYAGISGCGTPWDREIFERCCVQLLPTGVELRVGSDSTCALNAEIGPGSDGILLIVGTGSIAILRQNGTSVRIGGYGYLVGDEGSGFDMGRRAVAAALKAYDGRGQQTLLVPLLEEKSGVPIAEITRSLYEGGRTAVASYASALIDAAEVGDTVALQQVDECIRELTLHIQTASRKADGKLLPVVVAGGLVLNKPFLLERLQQANPSASMIPLKTAPVYGAVLEAVGSIPEHFRDHYHTDESNIHKGE